MVRAAVTLVMFAALAAWAGAQGPPAGLTAAEKLRMLRANRLLLENLVDHGVELGGAGGPLDRAAACQKTLRVLAVEIERAAGNSDADRIAELGGHLESVVADGLAPNLDDATKQIPAGSPDEARLKRVRADAIGDLTGLQTAIPEVGKLGDAAKVKEVRGKLDGLKERLK